MITFKSVKWRNFLSTGAAGSEINLNQHKTTLVTGKNGSGKSTGLTDAICFALFNKPFRNINKGQLVNSINGKNCVVEVEFNGNGKSYRVVRGIKPNIFDIYIDGELVDKEAASKDYQAILENQILKFNFKTFTQTVLLGSASYIPFMQLPAGTRREVIEDVLDIGIFSSMSDMLKTEIAATKNELVDIEYQIKSSKDKIESQNKSIAILSESKEAIRQEHQSKISDLTSINNRITVELDELTAEQARLVASITDRTELDEQKNKANTLLIKTQSAESSIQKDIQFFESHDSCPTCSQNIQEEHKHNIIGQLKTNSKSNRGKVEVLEGALSKLNTKLAHINEISSQINNVNIKINSLNNEIRYNSKQIDSLYTELNQEDTGNIEAEKRTLKLLAADAVTLVETKNQLLETKLVQDQAALLLKDNGIKTSIIKEYLPIINKQINKYLSEMDFFCNFELDETFTEKIRSRYRDEYSYANFSEGEKQRIDIALMLTFRTISKMKNSLDTNLLILDEIFSSSLDVSAVSFLTDMLNNMQNANIFVITHHADQFMEDFEHHIIFEKRNDFSIIRENL